MNYQEQRPTKEEAKREIEEEELKLKVEKRRLSLEYASRLSSTETPDDLLIAASVIYDYLDK